MDFKPGWTSTIVATLADFERFKFGINLSGGSSTTSGFYDENNSCRVLAILKSIYYKCQNHNHLWFEPWGSFYSLHRLCILIGIESIQSKSQTKQKLMDKENIKPSLKIWIYSLRWYSNNLNMISTIYTLLLEVGTNY